MAKLNLIKDVQSRTGTTDLGAPVIRTIALGDIVVRKNVRDADKSNIDELKQTIKQEGLLQPITVYKEGDEYVVTMGHRRLRAYRELYAIEPDRFHSIRCIVTDNKNITVRQLIENVQREDLKPIELYHGLKELQSQGLNYNQIAGMIGKAEGYVKNLFAGVKEIETDPENLDILKKSHHVTLTDFQTVKSVKDKKTKQKLLHAKANRQITQRDFQLQARASSCNKKDTARRTVTLDMNETKMTIKITLKEKEMFRQVSGQVKKLLRQSKILTTN